MNQTPREKDKLLVSLAVMVTEPRLKLNYPEAVAPIAYDVLEGAGDVCSVATSCAARNQAAPSLRNKRRACRLRDSGCRRRRRSGLSPRCGQPRQR